MARTSRKLSPVVTPPEPARPEPAEAMPALEGAPATPANDAPPDEADPAAEQEDAPRRISQPPVRARKDPATRTPRPHGDAEGGPVPTRRRTAARKSARAGKDAAVTAVVSRRRELAGLVLLALGVLCVMALWSYRPNDGPWAVPRRPTQNWVGPVGAMIADGLIGLLGVGAHVLASGLLLLGAMCFQRRPPTPTRLQVVGAALTLVCAAIVGHLAFAGTGALSYAPGGLLGALCGDGLARLFSAPGTAVIAGAGFAAGIMLCTDFSLSRAFRFMGYTLDHLLDRVRELADIHREKKVIRRQQEEEAMAAMLEQARQEEERLAAERAERQERRRQAARLKAELAVEREALQAREQAEAAAREQAESEAPTTEETPVAAIVSAPAVQAPAITTSEGPAIVAPARDAPTVEPVLPAAAPAPSPAAAAAAAVAVDAPPAAADAPADEPRIVEFVPRSKPLDDKTLAKRDASPRPFAQKFELPPVSLLDYKADDDVKIDEEALKENAKVLQKTFRDFGIEGYVREIRPGPIVTTYEFTLAPGIRVSKVANMANELAMALEAMSVRIVAPIPGKNAVGIEIPNNRRQGVYLKEIIAHPDFQNSRSKLQLALGKDIEGKPFSADLAKMPHVLVAGTTGSGKSVSVNGMILSILYRASPDDVRFLMIDPKMLELKLYEGIPHLLLPPVTDPKKAALALRWAVDEMERRYELLADFSVRDVLTFNSKMDGLRATMEKGRLAAEAQEAQPGDTAVPVVSVEEAGAAVEDDMGDTGELDRKAIQKHNGIPDRLPYIVVVVDEFADLMMVASKDVEMYVARLAQKARACGIHVLLATQRPSVDVITGVIKANFPTRMSFRVASSHDSKTIINCVGAERLLGNGDMLMIPPGTSDLQRVHGGYVSETEINRVVNFWKAQGKPQYNEAILRAPESEEGGGEGGGDGTDEPYDEFFDKAVDIVARTRKVSISEIQRKLGVGYNRAAKMVERMEKDGLIGPSPGSNKPREIYVRAPDGAE